MKHILWFFLVPVLVFSFIKPVPLHAAKGDIAVRNELEIYADLKDERWFATSAVIKGECRSVNNPPETSKNVTLLYKLKYNGDKLTALEKIGMLYYDNGEDSICFFDYLPPFRQKNVNGEEAFVSGYMKNGADFNKPSEIMIVDSLHLQLVDNGY